MAFLNPIFLLGVMAAGLPVLVHLVRRTRAVKIQYPSLMFLRRIEQKTIRKRRLRNLLLLALRCAALLLLALAFARPYFTGPSPVSAASDRPTSVILVDGSYSMRYGDVFDRAKQAARDAINNSPVNEQTALVLFSQSYEILMPLKANRAEALAILDQMQPGLGTTDYLQAIQAAISILKDAGESERRIHLISDFQEAGWNRAAPPIKVSPEIKLIPVDVSDAKAANLAISDVKSDPVVYAQKYASKVVARINHFGADAGPGAAVELKLNDLTVERRQLNLEAGASQAVEFTGFNVPEGSNGASVEISGDGFPLDNKFFFTIRRENQAKVLVIETAVRGRSESFFIKQSIDAGENNQHSLTLKTPGTVNPSELELYRAVIINDAADIGDALRSALKNFVERGGGLIIAAGKHTDSNGFNRAFAGLAPAQLGESVQSRGYALMSQIKTDHPIFGPFARSGRFTSTRVYAYHRATANEGAMTIAALDDGSPILVEGSAGRGKVLLLNTSLDTAWNDLPLTPMFLPLVRQMLEYLGGREETSAYTIGQVFAATPDAGGALPSIESPSGRRLDDARRTSVGELSIDASEQGFYKLRYRDHVDQRAVNVDRKESDFARLNLDEFIASISPGPADKSAPPLAPPNLSAEEIEAKQRLWLPLLILSLALFVVEALLARRIRIAKLVG
jgi:von Willebrand factor type A domain/Aerotolerance regulator N-terminal